MHIAQNKVVSGSRFLALGVLLALMAAMLLAAGSARASTTFTVNSTTDHSDAVLTIGSCDTGYQVPGPGGATEAECTLRAAIEQANYTPGADTINFAILGSGVKTITPASGLPAITGPVSINGYSQPGGEPNAKAVGSDAVLKIELSGASAPEADGLVISASNSAIKGLVINGWTHGILIDGPDASGNKVTGNYIGTDFSGTQYRGNDIGVFIFASNNTVGGTTAGERNTISANAGSGVSIYGDTATGNRILQNSIFSNGGLGIDLGDDGPTANDPADVDTGPNNLQNNPVLSSARTSTTSTTVRGTLNSTPNKTFTVRFFSNPSGTDEGRTFIGQKTVTTDASGNVTFAFSPSQKVGVGRTVTATATSPVGNTSEFSAPRTVVAS